MATSSARRRGVLLLPAFVVLVAAACANGEVPVDDSPSEVTSLLADRPSGAVSVRGALFETTRTDDGGTESVELVLCDWVGDMAGVPDVPPQECKGASVKVPPTVGTLDLDWSEMSSTQRFTRMLTASGTLGGGNFEVTEVEFDGETYPVR